MSSGTASGAGPADGGDQRRRRAGPEEIEEVGGVALVAGDRQRERGAVGERAAELVRERLARERVVAVEHGEPRGLAQQRVGVLARGLEGGAGALEERERERGERGGGDERGGILRSGGELGRGGETAVGEDVDGDGAAGGIGGREEAAQEQRERGVRDELERPADVARGLWIARAEVVEHALDRAEGVAPLDAAEDHRDGEAARGILGRRVEDHGLEPVERGVADGGDGVDRGEDAILEDAGGAPGITEEGARWTPIIATSSKQSRVRSAVCASGVRATKRPRAKPGGGSASSAATAAAAFSARARARSSSRARRSRRASSARRRTSAIVARSSATEAGAGARAARRQARRGTATRRTGGIASRARR